MKPKTKELKLAMLISGGGTNLQAMIDRIEAGKLDAEISIASLSSLVFGFTLPTSLFLQHLLSHQEQDSKDGSVDGSFFSLRELRVHQHSRGL